MTTMNKTYWKGIEELEQDPSFIQARDNEFAEHLPVDEFLSGEQVQKAPTSRRDFLKYLGFGVTAATLAACEAPVNKAIPYIIKPEEITPGIANWYASSYFDGNDYCSVLVKTREGRPIKIEGNKSSSVTEGSINARVQAGILSLYDESRLRNPMKGGQNSDWASVDQAIISKLKAAKAAGKKVRILTSSTASPSTSKAIQAFLNVYGAGTSDDGTQATNEVVTYDAVSRYGIIEAHRKAFGRSAVPAYSFDKADVVVSIGADFLANWVSPVEFMKQYGKKRNLKENKTISKHIQFETHLSLTGSNADERIPMKPSQQGQTVLALYNAVASGTGNTPGGSASLPFDEKIKSAASHLLKNPGKSLVVCGSNDPNVQLLVTGINNMLGNYGKTLDIERPSLLFQSDDAAVDNLIKDMQSGQVGALLIYNTNPVYSLPDGEAFKAALKKVDLTVSFAPSLDETAASVEFVCPDSHFLESWNDHSPRNGEYSVCQPTISPLFKTRQYQESLLAWAGQPTSFHDFIRKQWEADQFTRQSGELMFDAFWNNSLHKGCLSLAPTALIPAVGIATDLSAAASAVANSVPKGGAYELVLYEKTGVGNGMHANNPWLQELPDPISKICWDNYVTMNPVHMKELGFNTVLGQQQEADVITLTVGKATLNAPVYPQPGQAKGTIGLALGYGRTTVGKAGKDVGVNAYKLATRDGNGIVYYAANCSISGSVGKMHLATTQTHHTLMGRDSEETGIVKETTLAAYMNDASSGNKQVTVATVDHKHETPDKVDLWKSHTKDAIHWNLSVDLTSCIGCGACAVSCISENNIAVVGKDEVRRSREMHWIRIDRYYSSDYSKAKAKEEGVGKIEMYHRLEEPSENPQVVFQPVMCQHCNHAPCETVCPVAATSHSNEGLNMMTYNRCVGTKYCQNNCPYKVRRFNWYSYPRDSKFTDINPSQNELGRLVLNPDVVVRSRGVMEKCSMCVQRLQEGKLEAKKEGRPIKDGEVQTACSAVCPTHAIRFGNVADENSEVRKLSEDPRTYYLLEELNVKPSVQYMTKVRNTDKA
ncbi:MAG: TAT-variant-translocated molybdopterin oxidoreductase [Flavobacteriales bacterium]|nr:TAT-variant-translocated molybdopterin oxidoreductase [Flavobacteriales bacterium]